MWKQPNMGVDEYWFALSGVRGDAHDGIQRGWEEMSLIDGGPWRLFRMYRGY